MRVKSIDGRYIGDVIGYCRFKAHPGALNHKLAAKHRCTAKRCKHFETYSEPGNRKDRYRNRKEHKG